MKVKLFSISMILSLFIVLLVSCKQDVDEKEKEHVFGEWNVVTEPTCTSIGIKKRICSGCGFEETETIPAKEHDFDDGVITTAPTCTSSGIKTYTCSRCKETKTEIISANGHSYDDGVITTAPTCTSAGFKTYTCIGCKEKKIEVILAKGHNFDDGVITKEPTCTEEGIKTYTCSVCKEVKMQSIQALGHSFDGIKCSRCGQYSVKLSEVGKTYTDTDGLDVVLNNFSYSDAGGYNNYSINYTLKNNKQGSEIAPGIFKIIYKTASGALESNYQTGFFNNLYHNDTLTRSYNWKLTSDKTLVCLEYIAGSQMGDYIFSSTPSDSLLNWALGIISSTTDNNILSIILSQDTTAPSRGSVTVNVEIPNCSLLNMVKYSLGSKNTNFFETDGILIVPVDGIYSFTVKENGTYTVFAFDNDGRRETKEIKINNIDNIPPVPVTNLEAKYDSELKEISLNWKNPNDSDFDFVELSYTKGDIATVSSIKITEDSYSISNVEIDGDEYVFSVYAVDKVGNKSEVSTVYLIPSAVPSVQSISLNRYHLAYNDPDQTITATAVINNVYSIEEGTVVKFQTKDSSGNVTNTVANIDKELGIATATITVPTSTSNSNDKGTTYTVLFKIGDESADTVHTARFNVSSSARLSGMSQSTNGYTYSTNKVEISLSDVTSFTTETVRIQGYNLDFTIPSIQLYDSKETEYFAQPVKVDTNSVQWTSANGTNYQTIDTEISIPTREDTYTVKILFDGIEQEGFSRQIRVYDVLKFTSITIPLVSVSKEDNIVTATIIGKNFDTPDVNLSNFTANCSGKTSVAANARFVRISDSVINVNFKIPGTVGEYDVTVAYGTQSVTGKIKAADFSTYKVGDVLLNDGTIVAYDADNLSYSDEQKAAAVGVLYGFDQYGVPVGYLGIYNSTGGKNRGNYMWAPSGTKGYNTNFTGIQCTLGESYSSDNIDSSSFKGDTDGSDNWAYICSIDPEGTTHAATNYPAFNYVNAYANTFGLTGAYETGWYMPSLAELCYISKNWEVLNIVLNALGGIQLNSYYYWSSSQQDSSYSNSAWSIALYEGKFEARNSKFYENLVCVVRAFSY